MSISKLKNVLIIFLALSAIYLTGQLWFEKFSNRNFFYSISSSLAFNQAETDPQAAHVLKPFRIIANFGTTNYGILYSDLDESPQRLSCDKVLSLALTKGDFVKAEELNWISLLANKSLLYDYTFSVPTDFFTGTLGQKTANLTSRFKAFNAVCIVPSRTTNEKTQVYFIDEENKMSYGYAVSTGALNDTLLAALDDMQNKQGSLFYVSSVQKEYSMLGHNNFVPQWSGEGYEYNMLTMSNPYAPKGDLILDTIEAKIEDLFDSPEKRYSGRANDGIYTFSNQNTVMRYYPNDILEYADYRVSNVKVTNATMASDYIAALNFLKKDKKTVTNDYYLSKVQTDDNVHTFYFSYTVNNFPLNWSETFVSELKMDSPIKITVENNKVSKYKKLVYHFDVDEEYLGVANKTFIDSYDSNLRAGDELIQIDRLSMGYKMEKSKNLRLYWFMDMKDSSFVDPAQK